MSGPKVGLNAALEGFGGARTGESGGSSGSAPGASSALDLFGGAEMAAPAVEKAAGPGRRPGVPNRRTDSIKTYIMALGYKHPALVLADMASASVKQLMRAAPGLKAGEALAAKRQAAESLMPYFERKLPTAVEVSADEGRPVMIIGNLGMQEAEAGGQALGLDDAIDALVGAEPLSEEDQALSEAENGRPEFSVPTEEGYLSEDKEENDH